MAGDTFSNKKGASEPFLQRANEHSTLWTNKTNFFDALMVIYSTNKMPATDIPQGALPCFILDKTETRETMEMAGAAICSFTKQLGFVKPILLLRLPRLKILERYLDRPEFDHMKPLEDREGEPFIIQGRGEMMRDDELGLSN